ncbi:DUF1542 domain-containing protein [Winkia neuii]|nr:DUF1542 domain-containing protein [Winkia neuii]MDK8098627.1 DUF1542 domain-containing protein [Winkia neuii]
MNKKLLTKSSYGSSKHALTALVAGALATSLLTAPAVAAENSASTPQPDPNQTMQEVDKTEAGYAAALQNLPETVKNNTFADNAFTAAADKLNLKPGAIKEVNELGGWRAIDGGTFAVAKARKDGLYLNSMLGSSTTNVQEHPNTADQWNPEVQYFVNEQATGKAPYVLAIGRGWDYFSQQTGAQKINGKNFVQPFHGIERSFKAYSKEYGSQVVVDFNTGSLAQTSRAAGYTVRVLATKDGKESEIYTASFDPGKQDATAKYTVTPFGEGKGTPTFNYNEASKEEIADGTAIPYTRSKTGGTVQYASQATFKKPANLDGIESGAQGRFTSRPITLEKGVTDYKVQITSDFDNDNGVYESWGSDSSLKLQRSVKHYVNPLFNGFYVDQKTDLTAKELLKAQLAALKAKRDEYVKGKSDPSIAKLDEAIKAAEDAVNAQDVKKLSEYKELGKKLTESKDQLIDITDALNAVQKELDNKLAEIKDAPGALDADKAEAKKAAEAAAEKAKAAIKAVAAKEDLPKVRDEGVNSIKAVTVSNKEALAAKVNDDPAFQKTPGYINAKEQSFQNSDGTPNAEKNQKASKHLSDYEAALQKAKDVLAKPTATQDEVNKALDELNKARAPFASEDATDLAPLKDSLNKNGQVEKTAPIYVNATGEEQQAYDQAMKAAEDLLKDPNATQSQVNAAKKALDDAKAALDKRATDKTKLSAAVTASVDNNDGKTSVFYKNAKNPNYKVPAGTDPQAAKGFADAYDKALENAKKVLADPQATQKQVDEATAALKKAEADLQKLSSDPKDLIEEVNNQITVQGLPAFANLKEKAQKDGADS